MLGEAILRSSVGVVSHNNAAVEALLPLHRVSDLVAPAGAVAIGLHACCETGGVGKHQERAEGEEEC